MSVPKRDMLPWWRQIDWVEKKIPKITKFNCCTVPLITKINFWISQYLIYILICMFLSWSRTQKLGFIEWRLAILGNILSVTNQLLYTFKKNIEIISIFYWITKSTFHEMREGYLNCDYRCSFWNQLRIWEWQHQHRYNKSNVSR